ncbi:TPA: hypothetical protein KOY69_002010 [Clostridioides difficile]|nr:hypothetical protein [Clostridioides difficile]HBF8167729.1 hypothetical protein [Clostridioides difficile]
MKFYCNNCNEYFNLEDVSIKYDYSLAEEVIICPTCRRNLITLARKTELSLGFDKDINQLICVEYDSSDYTFIRKENIDIEDISKPIISYMKKLNKENLTLNGITITRSDDMSTKSILKNIDIKDENSAEKLISALEESEDKLNKKHDINWTLVLEDDITKWMLGKALKIIEGGGDSAFIEGGILNIGEVELKNLTLTIFESGKIILRNENIEISGYYEVNRKKSKES